MTLPIVLPSSDEKWDCHQCGVCCRGSLVRLSDDDIERLRSQKWDEQPEYRKTPIMARVRGTLGEFRLASRSDGSCVFLNDDGRCRIHSKFGSEAKPIVCQTFPLQLVSLEKQAILTTRRACPSAAADLGRPTSTHLAFIQQLVGKEHLKADPIAAPLFKTGEARDWKVARCVLNAVTNLLRDERYPPVRRLVHALQFARHLELAKTKSLNDQQIISLISTLEELSPEESKPLFDTRQEPKGYAKVMFRLMAVDCARLHPDCRPRSQWTARMQLIKTTWKAFRGTGLTPAIGKIFPRIEFEEFEKPLVSKKPQIYQSLERFIEATATSYLYAIANRRDWTLVESIRGLAILFPIGLWLLRWLTHGRDPNYQDMVNIVVALDRSQGYRPHAGALHRWRLFVIGSQSELERLVIWYAR